MRKRIIGFLSFGATVAVLIAALKLINWVPSVVEEGFIRQYKSVEEVQSKLKIKDVYIPSYFPQSFRWPPNTIWAQTKPFTAIVMEFRNQEKGDIGLVISQVVTGARFIPESKIRVEQVRERVDDYPLKGRRAVLEVGTGQGDEPCSSISWTEGGYRMTVIMKSAPFDLLKIAESMGK
jgi:hypothetical protein